MKMLTCSFLSGLFAATLLPASAATVGPISAAEAEKVTERIELLTDGNIAKHWYTWLKGEGRASDTNKVFTAEGSTLKVSGKVMGCVTTRKAYCDYRLSLEYRFVDNDVQFNKKDARDGGILFHSTGEDGVFWGAWMNSFECNIIQGATGDLIVVGDQSASRASTAARAASIPPRGGRRASSGARTAMSSKSSTRGAYAGPT